MKLSKEDFILLCNIFQCKRENIKCYDHDYGTIEITLNDGTNVTFDNLLKVSQHFNTTNINFENSTKEIYYSEITYDGGYPTIVSIRNVAS